MTKKSPPKTIVEFGHILDYPFVYAQLISMTVSIYKSQLRDITKKLRDNKPVKIPRHPRTMISKSFMIAKNRLNYDEKFLMDYGVPSVAGLKRSIAMVAKDVGVTYNESKDKKRTPLTKKTFLGPMLYGVAVGDYIDCNYEKIKEQVTEKAKGSKNHTCPVDQNNLKKELKVLRSAMDKVFACDTAFGDCNNKSMASGHCMLSSLIIQDLFGGDIKGGSIGSVPHYWNSFCHYDVDLTGDQFGKPKIQVTKKNLYSDSYRFDRDPFESMNQDFNEEVWKKHCKFRKRVQKELQKTSPELAQKLKKATTNLRG